jgi:hypothetical protein
VKRVRATFSRMLALLTLLALCVRPAAARAEAAAAEPAADSSLAASSLAESAPAPPAPGPTMTHDGLEALVPELAEHPYHLPSGVRPFQNRIAFSPGYGSLGSKPLFIARVTYHPSPWLGYEWSLGHNPGQSVHAALHMLSVIVRRPLAGRFQPYLAGGYGMMLVFPGQSLNAAPVTKNALAIGGGLEFYIRGDLAIRADLRHDTVLGRERDRPGTVAYDYFQQSIGLAFYRSIRP